MGDKPAPSGQDGKQAPQKGQPQKAAKQDDAELLDEFQARFGKALEGQETYKDVLMRARKHADNEAATSDKPCKVVDKASQKLMQAIKAHKAAELKKEELHAKMGELVKTASKLKGECDEADAEVAAAERAVADAKENQDRVTSAATGLGDYASPDLSSIPEPPDTLPPEQKNYYCQLVASIGEALAQLKRLQNPQPQDPAAASGTRRDKHGQPDPADLPDAKTTGS